MSAPVEALKRLEMHWIPAGVLSDVQRQFVSPEMNGQPLQSLVVARQKLETAEGADKRIRDLQLRVIRATARALNRNGEIDWDAVLEEAKDPRKLLEIFYTLNFSRFSVSRPSHLQHEFGKRLRAALQRKYGSHQVFYAQLIGALESDQQEYREQRQQTKDMELRKVRPGIAAAETPEEMRSYFRTIGLPSDCYRNAHWPQTLWRFRRRSANSLRKTVVTALEEDSRFKDYGFQGWIEPHRSRQRWSRNHPQTWELLGQSRKHDVVKKIDPHVEPYIERILRKYPHEQLPDDEYALLFPFDRTDSQNPWAQLCACIDSKNKNSADAQLAENEQTLILVRVLSELLWDFDRLTSCERTDWCNDPSDFEHLFRTLGLERDQWQSKEWMENVPALTKTQGGRGRDFSSLVYAIESRFGGYDSFIAWMEGKADESTVVMQKVRACRSAGTFRTLCKELGIPNDHWKSESWMLYRAQLPLQQGGIAKDVSTVVRSIVEHPYLNVFELGEVRTYREFVNAADSSLSSAEQAWDVIYSFCERLGMSVNELLQEKNRYLVEHHPDLLAAQEFLCAHG